MENVPPLTMTSDNLPTLDDLLRPRRNVKASRQKRSPALSTRTDGDHEDDEDSRDESGLLTPPSSQTQEEDTDASRMLFSPPPEDELRNGRNLASRSRSVPLQQPVFTPALSADTTLAEAASSKRKRHGHNRSSSHAALESITNANSLVTEATPNPKPKKQSKRGSPSRPSIEISEEPTTPTRAPSQRRSQSPTKRTLCLSPYRDNPNADYLPPLPDISRPAISTRRRSITPMPPYEPPEERFTPPREIIHTPPRATQSPERITKSSKRKSTAPRNAKLVLTIKRELPEIDLSLPPPPPSPSDDPLLLKGLPGQCRGQKQKPRLPVASSAHSRDTPPVASSPPVNPTGASIGRLPDLNSSIDLSMHDDDDMDNSFAGAPPIFDLTGAEEDPRVWDDVDSDSDPDEFDQLGEYTGRFKMLVVPTKMDPPSSCTRTRQDAWGHPISPYPGSGARRRSLPSSSSPPLKLGPNGQDGTDSGESPDEEDVFFLDIPTVDEEDSMPGVVEGSSRGVVDNFVDDSTEMHEPLKAPTPEPSPPPLPIVEAPEVDYASGHHVRFVAARNALEDVSMVNQGDVFEYPQPQEDMDITEEGMGNPAVFEDHDADDSDSSDEQTVDRELSREPGHCSDRDEDEEDRDPRPHSPTIATPPRAITPVRSVSPQTGQITRPRGFLSITSPLRRQRSPQLQVNSELLPSIQTILETTSAPVPMATTDTGTLPDVLVPGSSTEGAEVATSQQLAEDDRGVDYVASDVGESSDDESDDLDNGVVKITSGDPRVAARAAAILKMHDYDFIIRDRSRTRRQSSVESAMRKTRRQSVIEGGVSKRGTPIRRRRTLGGVIGDKVIIPGSPIITVPQLLQEAELTVEQRERSLHTPSRGGTSFGDKGSFKIPLPLDRPLFETPAPRSKVFARPTFNASGPRAWEKDDWKLLDACFTDERLALGSHKRLGEAVLAPVDDVVPDHIVSRFLEHTGGVPIDGCWPGWTVEQLTRRVQALQRKQRAGKGAPPTPSGRFSSVALSEVPDFTPLPSRQPSMQPGPDRQGTLQNNRPVIPASLLAPRYSHLLDEAVAISRDQATPQTNDTQPVEYRSASLPAPDERNMSLPPQSPATVQRSESEAPTKPQDKLTPSRSIASRMKGFFFSYLPRASKPGPAKKRAAPAHPGLPIPPPEVFQKPRGPIATPVSKPASKPVHPKDLVQLNPAPAPKPSLIPRPAQQRPRRLVELHPAPAPVARPRSSTGSVVSDRRSSSGSVKDLVRGFEDLERRQERERLEEETQLRRVKSVGEWAAAAGTQHAQQRPTWKP